MKRKLYLAATVCEYRLL